MTGLTRAVISIAVLAALGPYLADRYQLPILLYKNHPKRLESTSVFKDYQIRFKDVVRNCEDVLIDEAKGVAFLSCDAGRDWWNTVLNVFIDPDHASGSIFAYKYTEDNDKPHQMPLDGFGDTREQQFHPLGIGYHAQSRTLYVVNHCKTGSTVEVFTVDEAAAKLSYVRTIQHPLLPTPNSIVPISADEVYITNDHKWVTRTQPMLAKFETLAAYAGGNVMYMNFATNETRKVAELPFANGIAQLSGNRIAVASTTLPAVLIYAMDPKTHALKLLRKLRTPFWPDNLRTDSRGKLLIAGNPWALKVEEIAEGQHKYDFDDRGEAESGLLSPEHAPRSASWVAEWDGTDAGQLQNLYVGDEYSTSTSAVRDVKRGMGLVTGLYERGVMVWKE